MNKILPFARPFILEQWIKPGPKLPYGGCFIFNKRGLGRIRFVGQKARTSGDYLRWLTVNGVPILSWLEKNNCPTCEQILQSGNKDFDTSEALQKIHETHLDEFSGNPGWYEVYYALLDLLDPGIYFLTVNKYYPTDGDGSLFWGSYNKPKVARAINFDFGSSSDQFPCFLIGTQSVGKYSPDRLARGKERYRSSPGIAFHLDGYISALLDGHHRALAAAQAGEPFHCVTISMASWYWLSSDMKQPPTAITGLFNFEMRTDELSKDATRWLKKATSRRGVEKSKVDGGFQTEESRYDFDTVFFQAEKHLERYPTVEDMSAATMSGTISDDDIVNAFRTTDACPDLGKILNSFIGTDDPRARDMAIGIVRDENWQSLWANSLNYLSRFNDSEILAIFWDKATRDDIKREDINKEINRYIEENAEKYKN